MMNYTSFEEVLDEFGIVQSKEWQWCIEDKEEMNIAKQVNNFIKTGNKDKENVENIGVYRW